MIDKRNMPRDFPRICKVKDRFVDSVIVPEFLQRDRLAEFAGRSAQIHGPTLEPVQSEEQ